MEKDVLRLIELFDSLNDTIDPDGVCENSCACGECDNCISYSDLLHDFYLVKEKYKRLLGE